MASHVGRMMKNVVLDEPTSFLDQVYLGCTQRECKPNEIIIEQNRGMLEEEEELESVGELSKISSQIVQKCLCLTRIGGPDILWSVNKLTRSVTKLTQSL